MKTETSFELNSPFKVECCNIRKSLKNENMPLLEINITYPRISADSEFSVLFNSFYEKIANNYSTWCEEMLYRKLLKKQKNDTLFRPYGEIMKYFITYNSDKYISVVCDISHFDGYKKETKRFAFVWSCENKIVLPFEHFEKELCLDKKDIRKKICETILGQIKSERCEFDYSERSLRRYAGHVNFSNFFLTKAGLAFWFDKGTLASADNGFPTFIYKIPN